MMYTRSQAQELDRISMNERGIKGIDLMGAAGKAVAGQALRLLKNPKKSTLLILCGKGNNGGDGFAAAIHLQDQVSVLTIQSLIQPEQISGDSKYFYNQCIKDGIKIVFDEQPSSDTEHDLIIDALLGTGFKGLLRDPIKRFCRWINKQKSIILSVDIPSGVDSNNGITDSDAVLADTTITMGSSKLGMEIQPGKAHCGKTIAADIGFPDISEILTGISWQMFQENICTKYLKPPSPDTYKHQQGKVLVIAGSKGMTGAAVLATFGALRSGAGLTMTAAPKSLHTIYESQIIEGLTIDCDDHDFGYFLEKNVDELSDAINWCDTILIGPGMRNHPETQALIKKIILESSKPMVIDADALLVFNDHLELFDSIKAPFVITPHFGEFSALLGIEPSGLKENYPEIINDFMLSFSGVLALKNAPTITYSGGKGIINASGNPGLATGGTGDVFAGICAGLISQGIPIFDAVTIAAYIHGKAADMVSENKGFRGLIASDLLTAIPSVISEYEQL